MCILQYNFTVAKKLLFQLQVVVHPWVTIFRTLDKVLSLDAFDWAKRQVLPHHEHCKFCFCINKFIALFCFLYHKAGYPLISFFGCNVLFLIFRGDVLRYVILSSSSYANVYFERITFSVFIPFMASTYERIIFLPSLLVLAPILVFFYFYPPLLATLADHFLCAY